MCIVGIADGLADVDTPSSVMHYGDVRVHVAMEDDPVNFYSAR